jgi:hypothetical protein
MLRSEKARSDLFWKGTEGRRETETKVAQAQYDLQIEMCQRAKLSELRYQREQFKQEQLARKEWRKEQTLKRECDGKQKVAEIQARYNELKAARDSKA